MVRKAKDTMCNNDPEGRHTLMVPANEGLLTYTTRNSFCNCDVSGSHDNPELIAEVAVVFGLVDPRRCKPDHRGQDRLVSMEAGVLPVSTIACSTHIAFARKLLF